MVALFAAHVGLTNAATIKEDDRLLVLGDSLSAAYGLDVPDGWVVQLEKRLQPLDIKVINASIGGETTSGGLSRLPRLLERHQPDWVLIQLGANDGLRGIPLTVIRENLAGLLEIVRDAGARPVLIGIMLPPNYGPMYADRFAAMYEELAVEQSVPLLPFLLEGVADDPALMQEDGLHPTAEAQAILFENVWEVLAPQIKVSTP